MSKELEKSISKEPKKSEILCAECPKLLEKAVEQERERNVVSERNRKLRETIYNLDREIDILKAQNVEEKKRREFLKGLWSGFTAGATGVVMIALIVCMFLSQFHVI